jgi:hypothetical protein
LGGCFGRSNGWAPSTPPNELLDCGHSRPGMASWEVRRALKFTPQRRASRAANTYVSRADACPRADWSPKDWARAPASRLWRKSTTHCEPVRGTSGPVRVHVGGKGWPVPFARSGRTFGDRGGQLGLVRAWIGDNAAALTTLLRCHSVVYGEWLRRRHTVPYDALPDWLVVLDLRRGDGTLVAPGARDEECACVGLTTPPALFVGTLGDLGRLRKLVGRSRFGSESAEGAVLRGLGGSEPRPVAKWLAPGWRRANDAELSVRVQNGLRG